MQAYLMGYMGETSLLRSYPASYPDGISHQLMAMVRLIEPEGIDHQSLHPFQVSILFIAHRLHIRDIGKLAETVAQDRHLVVHHPDRHELDVAYPIGIVRLDGMELQLRCPRIEFLGIFRKTVGHGMRQGIRNQFVAIDVDITKHAEASQIVDASYVIIMDMSNQHTIYLAERHTQELLTDIRSRIYQDSGMLRFYQRCTAQAVVARILAAAYLTITT